MNETDEFYTLKGYQIKTDCDLTAAMEDYLEMICRISQNSARIRVGDLSRKLHVKPSSATKMVQQLSLLGYLDAEKYGFIQLTPKGRETGGYLLYRHAVIHHFLCVLNNSDQELEQVEKIEHFLNRNTIKNLDKLTRHLLSEKAKESARQSSNDL